MMLEFMNAVTGTWKAHVSRNSTERHQEAKYLLVLVKHQQGAQ